MTDSTYQYKRRDHKRRCSYSVPGTQGRLSACHPPQTCEARPCPVRDVYIHPALRLRVAPPSRRRIHGGDCNLSCGGRREGGWGEARRDVQCPFVGPLSILENLDQSHRNPKIGMKSDHPSQHVLELLFSFPIRTRQPISNHLWEWSDAK